MGIALIGVGQCASGLFSHSVILKGEDDVKNLFVCVVTVLTLIVGYSIGQADTILMENFEDGILDPRISVQTVGTFISSPGIKDFTGLEGQYAFGFGRSTNRYNSFWNYVTYLSITFDQPSYVTSFSFVEMEMFDNWGSAGNVLIDGVQLEVNGIDSGTLSVDDSVQLGINRIDFGRLPHNDGVVTIHSIPSTVNLS